MNVEKSKFYVGAMSLQRAGTIQTLLGFVQGKLPFTYLGCTVPQI